MQTLTAGAIVAALSGTLPERPYFDPDDRIRWLAARSDAGDREGAARALLGDLGGAERPPPGLAEDGPRILAVLPPAEVLEGLLKSPHVYARFRDQLGDHPDDIVAGVFARCVTGGPDDEEAMLRAALAPTDHERTYRGGGYRPVRVSAVLAGLAETVAADLGRDAGETLDRWAAVLAESEYADGHRLAAAAALLAPLGLAEVDRRCDRVEDYDGPRLAAALARAGRLGEALELTTRIGPWQRQRALLGLADIADDAGLAKVHAAFRKAPKADRSRDAQMVWKHRLASLALRRGLADDAIATATGMKDCRIVDHGPAPLALEILRWLADRPAEATPERLRAIADVLAGPAVIAQELAAVVTEALLLLHRLADPALRAELAGARVPALRGRLSWNPPILVDAGVGTVERGGRRRSPCRRPRRGARCHRPPCRRAQGRRPVRPRRRPAGRAAHRGGLRAARVAPCGVRCGVPVDLRRARFAGCLLFLLFGAALGAWTARVPAVKHHLGVDDFHLSVALLGLAAGAIAGQMGAGRLVDRFGSVRVAAPTALAEGVLLLPAAYAPTLALLTVALVVFGANHGVLNVAMNANALGVQRAYGRPIISSFHAVYSIGGFAGAALGGLCAHLGLGVPGTFLIVCALTTALAAWALVWLAPEPPAEHAGAVGDARGARLDGVLVLGGLAFCALVGEGAAADWSAVYLRDNLGGTAGFAAAGYAAFAIAMTAGRVVGDRLTALLGPVRLVRLGGLLAAAGLGVALLADHRYAGVAGFACLGAGLSCVAPQVFSAATARNPARPARALSVAVSMGYAGFLAGPVLIGAATRAVTLPVALAIPAALALLVALSAGAVGRAPV
ncbi:hypothetical protein GCM10022255_098770 [Dactylosporangium darangshiense]|uniref:Uncharacterized protein n=1 Tax=Dactylosporangium darangshiense TaxID=579108 RepID=A0ABP8DR98_9ACTN